MKLLKKDMGYRGEVALLILVVIVIMAIWQIGAMCMRDFFDGISTKCWLPFADKDFVDPLGPVALAILLTLIPLFFTKEKVYRTWKKFSLWYVPISLYLIFTSSTRGIQFVTANEREFVTHWLSLLFIIISLLIILIRSWNLSEREKKI